MSDVVKSKPGDWRCKMERESVEARAKGRLTLLLTTTADHAVALCACTFCCSLRDFAEGRS